MTMTANDQPPNAPLRWAVLGTGSIAATFAQDIMLTANAKLVAVCSRTQEAATAFSQRFGGLRIIAGIDSLAADPLIDAVYLATPNTAHFDQARILMMAGKPVLIEKPVTMTAAQARSLAGLSAQYQCFAMEGMWPLFLPAFARMRELLARDTIGTITAVHAELAYTKAVDGNSRFFSQALGGGALLDLGVYPIALTLALFGFPRKVTGQWQEASTGVDMSATISLGYDGFKASLSCGFDRIGSNRFIIEGKTGCLVIDGPFLRANRIVLTRNRMAHHLALPPGSSRLSRAFGKIARALPLPGLTVHKYGFPGDGLQFEIEAASTAILEGRREETRIPLSASAEALGIIETILDQPPS
ncbi:Gfo/Idh/MocA family protein [Pararhizobium sp. PWRC1-1]|uniref:Gfo/Idh/MocA family protein n=1 Tax=Pararhizobium sp. PWRC1-1 TaxID=2804566 RepID=UPI003CEBC4E6